MCTRCLSRSDAPSMEVLIAVIKKRRRDQRRAKWISRASVLFFGYFVCFFTVKAFDGVPAMMLWAFVHLGLAWWTLRTAEILAQRLDHTKEHLRQTEALNNSE